MKKKLLLKLIIELTNVKRSIENDSNYIEELTYCLFETNIIVDEKDLK